MDAHTSQLLQVLDAEMEKILTSAEAIEKVMSEVKGEKADIKQADELDDESEGEGDEKDNEPE